MFAKPDYYLSRGPTTCSGSCVSINPAYAYNHGDYAPAINTTWLGLVGPGVAHKGVDGLGPSEGPNSAGPRSGLGTIPDSGTTGTWADHTDIRPTLLYLVGLQDDYTPDGRVLTEDLTNASPILSNPAVQALAEQYKQLNASVGQFGTSTLIAATHAMESASPDDQTYTRVEQALAALQQFRDQLATDIKNELTAAAFDHQPIDPDVAAVHTWEARALIAAAGYLGEA
jgi:hypothetical protein